MVSRVRACNAAERAEEGDGRMKALRSAEVAPFASCRRNRASRARGRRIDGKHCDAAAGGRQIRAESIDGGGFACRARLSRRRGAPVLYAAKFLQGAHRPVCAVVGPAALDQRDGAGERSAIAGKDALGPDPIEGGAACRLVS